MGTTATGTTNRTYYWYPAKERTLLERHECADLQGLEDCVDVVRVREAASGIEQWVLQLDNGDFCWCHFCPYCGANLDTETVGEEGGIV